ncbi:MAG: T9SS type A sorting domain-containing protein, partial [Flavobacteriaceae bacterium]
GSVVFDYNGQEGFRTESVAPYALGGDSGGNFNSLLLSLGANTVTATPFTGGGGSGDAGIDLTIDFEVVDTGQPADIISFVLVNADTDEVIGTLINGDVVNLGDFAANAFNISAEVDIAGVKSVVFDYNGVSNFRTENVAPYALGGDSGGNFAPLAFPLGINSVTATAYSSNNGGGAVLATADLSFEVIEEAAPEIGSGEGSVYPNPVQEIANVQLEEETNEQIVQASLFSLMGTMVVPPFEMTLSESGTGQIDMASLAQGIYILRITDNTGKVLSQTKVVKR